MKYVKLVPLLLAVALPVLAASPPDRLGYQGVLRDSAGAPRDGSFTMVFRFFDAAGGGNELLVNQPAPVTVANGLFHVALGSGSVLDGTGPGTYATLAEIFSDYTNVYMEIEVDGETLAPRVEVASSAYALNAARLEGKAAGEFVSWQDLPPMADDTPLGMLADRLQIADPQALPFAELGGFDCSGANTATMSLLLGGVPTGDVLGFVGSEEISRLFEFHVAIESSVPITPAAQIGTAAVLSVARGGATTTFSGRVTEFGLAASDGATRTYVLTVEPQMSVFERTVDYDIYESYKVSDVIPQLFSAAGLPNFTLNFVSSLPVYESLVRYNETDLAFLSRLMEEDGLHFHFVENGGDQAVFGDSNAVFSSLGTAYGYYGDMADPGTGEEYVSTLHTRERETTGVHTVRGWQYLSGSFSLSSGGSGLGELYEFYAEDVDGPVAELRRIASQNRENVRGEEQTGTSNIVDLRAGRAFDVTDTTASGLGGTKIATAVTHFAVRDPDPSCIRYGNRFTAIPSTVPYAPPRRTPKPVVKGPMTAEVSSNMDADALGRVKVEFHWDRSASASAWVRVASPSGGYDTKRWIPEVGDEVVVDFLQGDPDRPVIVGSVPNGASAPPPGDGDFRMKPAGPDGDQSLYFFEGANPQGEHLRWDDSATAFEFSDDVTIQGTRLQWGSGARIDSDATYSLYSLGQNATSDTFLYAGSVVNNGALRIFGNSTFQSWSGSGLFTWIDGPTSIERARLDAAGNFQIDGGATVSGGSLLLGAGPSFAGDSNGLTLAGGIDDFDDLTLRAGNDATDGQLQILGDSSATLYVGNGTLNVNAGDSGQSMFLSQTTTTINEWKLGGANLELYLGDTSLDNVYVPGDFTVSGVKNFVQNHPEDESLSVLYTALEGDEVGTYTRGSARLENGVARVPLGDTFRLTTNPEIGLTAHVTARAEGADLWVDAVSTTELVVRAQPGSDPEAAFDYIVHGLRIGYEDFSVIQPRKMDAPVPSAASYDRYYESHAGLRDHTAAARFAATTRAATGEPTASMRRRIGTFEPDTDEAGALDLSHQAGETPADRTAAVDPEPNEVERTANDENEAEKPRTPTVTPALHTGDPELATAVEVGDEVELGDLIVLDPTTPDRLVASTHAGDPTVIGIVAGRPGLLLGGAEGEGPSNVPLAFSGIAFAKVDAGYGAVRIGDLLTASPTRGHAMRADDPAPGTIVAKALEPLDTGTGLIRVLVMLR